MGLGRRNGASKAPARGSTVIVVGSWLSSTKPGPPRVGSHRVSRPPARPTASQPAKRSSQSPYHPTLKPPRFSFSRSEHSAEEKKKPPAPSPLSFSPFPPWDSFDEGTDPPTSSGMTAPAPSERPRPRPSHPTPFVKGRKRERKEGRKPTPPKAQRNPLAARKKTSERRPGRAPYVHLSCSSPPFPSFARAAPHPKRSLHRAQARARKEGRAGRRASLLRMFLLQPSARAKREKEGVRPPL